MRQTHGRDLNLALRIARQHVSSFISFSSENARTHGMPPSVDHEEDAGDCQSEEHEPAADPSRPPHLREQVRSDYVSGRAARALGVGAVGAGEGAESHGRAASAVMGIVCSSLLDVGMGSGCLTSTEATLSEIRKGDLSWGVRDRVGGLGMRSKGCAVLIARSKRAAKKRNKKRGNMTESKDQVKK